MRLHDLAAGHYDVQTQLEVTGSDEISDLAKAYNALTDGLAKLTLRGAKVARGELRPQNDGGGVDTIDTHGALAEAFMTLERNQAKLGTMARTIASDDLNNPLLDDHVVGVLGESFAEMTKTLRGLASQAHAIADGQLSHPALANPGSGDLGTAFHEMIQSLKILESQVEAIAHGRLGAEVLTQEVPGDLGELVAMLAHDLSSMKEQLLISERMSSMGVLAAGIGHEINNPLSYVLANVEWVHDELVDSDVDPEFIEALGEAKQGAQRVREITRDLNVFTRSQEGSTEPTDVLQVMESAIRMAMSQLRGHMELHRDFSATSATMASEGKLGQVFLNLIINASQSIPKEQNGHIYLRVRQHHSKIVVSIADDGPGIPPEIESKIFEPFFSTKKKAGTGLGLAICRQIITGFGGTIRAEATPGGGATFIIELALAEETTQASRPDLSIAAQDSEQLRILVVDDDEGVAGAVKRLIASHEVTMVHSGDDALAASQKEEFDIVLCDLMMPGMTGMELFERWQQESPGLSSKVIFLTGGAFSLEMRSFIESTKRPVLHKPVLADDLHGKIAELRAAH